MDRKSELRAIIRAHKRWDALFGMFGLLAMMVGVLTLAALFANMAIDGIPRLTGDFFTSFPSRRAGQAGILSAWIGSVLVMFVTAIVAVPLGIAGAIYLEEYARKNWFTDIIEINITNLAGVPSIVYGLLALGLFVYTFGLGQSILLNMVDGQQAVRRARVKEGHAGRGIFKQPFELLVFGFQLELLLVEQGVEL